MDDAALLKARNRLKTASAAVPEHIWELKKGIPAPYNPYLHYLKPEPKEKT